MQIIVLLDGIGNPDLVAEIGSQLALKSDSLYAHATDHVPEWMGQEEGVDGYESVVLTVTDSATAKIITSTQIDDSHRVIGVCIISNTAVTEFLHNPNGCPFQNHAVYSEGGGGVTRCLAEIEAHLKPGLIGAV